MDIQRDDIISDSVLPSASEHVEIGDDASESQEDLSQCIVDVSQNVKKFIEDKIKNAKSEQEVDTILREQQLIVFADLAVFMSSEDSKGSVILPTGSGKTVIMAELANAMFYNSAEDSRPKVLILVPNLKLVSQTIGEYDEEGKPMGGFARFAPKVTATPYHGQRKDTTGDVVVMTYQSLIKAAKSGELPKFDVALTDEAHRSLGSKTSNALENVTEGAKVIAFTATPDFSEAKSIRSAYGEVIHEMDLKEAIELGMLAPAQVWHYKTNVKLDPKTTGKEYKNEDLEKLISEASRNKAAIDLSANYVKQGMQGIIACVPGNECAHAKVVASMLCDKTIELEDGIVRNIVAKHVSGDTPPEELSQILDGYRRGEIDILTYVDLLTEGWDAPNAKFIINLRPTKSPVNAVQRLGRVLRLFKPESVAQIVEFVDDINGPEAYTALHALGDEDAPLNNGQVYGASRPNSEDCEIFYDELGEFDTSTELFLPDMEMVKDLIDSCALETMAQLYVGPEERALKERIDSGDLLTLQAAMDRIEELGASISSISRAEHISSVEVNGRTYYEAESVDEYVKNYLLMEESEVKLKDLDEIIVSMLSRRGVDREISVHRTTIRDILDILDINGRKVKLKNENYWSDVYDRKEIEAKFDRILTASTGSDFMSIYDYYHETDDGDRVWYLKDVFKRKSRVLKSNILNAFMELDTEERLDLVRITGAKAELEFSKTLLDAIFLEDRARYQKIATEKEKKYQERKNPEPKKGTALWT